MSWNLFLDDIREPSDITYLSGPKDAQFVVCRTMDEAVAAILEKGMPNFISFDHDLADEHYNETSREKTGYEFAKWLVNADAKGTIDIPYGFQYYVHSNNPVGKANICALLDRYIAYKQDERTVH